MRWSIQMFWWCEGHSAVAPNDPAQVTEDIIAEWFAIRNRSAFGEEVRTSVSPATFGHKVCIQLSPVRRPIQPAGIGNAAWCKSLWK